MKKSNRLFPKLNQLICNYHSGLFPPFIGLSLENMWELKGRQDNGMGKGCLSHGHMGGQSKVEDA